MPDFSKLQKSLEEIQNLRTDYEARLQHLEDVEKRDIENGNTDEAEKEAAKLGVDLSKKLTSSDLQNIEAITAGLEETADVLHREILNPENSKLKGVENIMAKLHESFDPDKDGKTVAHLVNSYIKEEQKQKAAGCFHYDQQTCNGGIIDAHSLQRRGPLERISELEDNQARVIHFERDILTNEWRSKTIATKEASTFKGFCHHHDGIFSEIEQLDYTGTNKQNFLHSYRSFAYSYHKTSEYYGYYQSMIGSSESGLSSILGNLTELQSLLGLQNQQQMPSTDVLKITEEQKAEIASKKFERHKSILNDALRNEKYDCLDYLALELQHICPIVCASLVKLHVEVFGNYIISDASENYNGYPMIITIFHASEDKSLILFARFKSDEATKIVFDELRKLSQEKLEQRLSTLIFEQVENFYLSPKFWRYFPQSEKDKITSDLNQEKEQFPYKSTFVASLNIFDRIHCLKN